MGLYEDDFYGDVAAILDLSRGGVVVIQGDSEENCLQFLTNLAETYPGEVSSYKYLGYNNYEINERVSVWIEFGGMKYNGSYKIDIDTRSIWTDCIDSSSARIKGYGRKRVRK